MTLAQSHHFCVRKGLHCLITLIRLIILISQTAQLIRIR